MRWNGREFSSVTCEPERLISLTSSCPILPLKLNCLRYGATSIFLQVRKKNPRNIQTLIYDRRCRLRTGCSHDEARRENIARCVGALRACGAKFRTPGPESRRRSREIQACHRKEI